MDCMEYSHALNVHVHHMIKIYVIFMIPVFCEYAASVACICSCMYMYFVLKRVGSILLVKIVDLQLSS